MVARKRNYRKNFASEGGFQNIQDLIGLALLFIAVFFLLYTTFPLLLNKGYINGGDNFIHTAEIFYMDRLFTEDGSLFGWYHMFNTGHPLFYFYQSLFHMIVVFFHNITALDLLYSEKVILIIIISLYPLSMFYFLTHVGYSRLISGLAALFSITSNAAWGNGITTYFYSGAITGAMGMLLFPIALALVYDSFIKNRSVWALLLVLILSMLAHYLICYMLWIILTIFLFFTLIKCDIGFSAFALRKYVVVVLAFSLLASFHIIPVLRTVVGQSALEILVQEGWYEGWYQNSFTLPETIDFYLNGWIFDVSNPEFRKYNWYNNSESGRLPILTMFSILGFIYCALKPTEKQNGFLSVGFLFSILLYSGEDDAIFLKLMPFHNHLWYIRAILIFEFFVVILAAVGMYQLCRLFTSLCTKKICKKDLEYRKGAVLTVVIFFFSIAVFGHLLSERYDISLKLVTVVNTDELASIGQLFSSAIYDGQGRMFVGHELNIRTSHGEYPVFAIESNLSTIMPPSWEQNYITQQLLTRLLPQGFDEPSLAVGIPNEPQLMDLYNIKYLLAAKNWGNSSKDPRAVDKILLANNSRFEFYEIGKNHTYFKFISSKPALAVASDYSWFNLGLQWLYTYQKNENFSRLPFIVKSKTNVLDDIEFDSGKYPVIILLDYDIRSRESVDSKIRDYVDSGGQIISWENGFSGNGTYLSNHGAWMDIILPKTPEFSGSQGIYAPESGLQRFKVKYHSDESRFIVFKMSYFQGWNALVDGERIEVVAVTPEFVGLWIPAGDHVLELKYGLDTDYVGYLLFLVGILAVLCANKRKMIFYGGGMGKVLVERPLVHYVLLFALLSYIGSVYVLQAYFYMPVHELPTTGDSYGIYRTPLIWEMTPINTSGNGLLRYEVEVSGCPLDFSNCILFNTTTSTTNYYLDSEKFRPGGIYAWHVRAVTDDMVGVWSIPDVFMTVKNAPNIGNVYLAD
ncbi:MAG: hypothetical protein V1875_00455 [Candidatus Altiarchaeota archaeon]